MQSDIRECASQLRQIESANYQAAMERASREIQHDNYLLRRLLNEVGLSDIAAEVANAHEALANAFYNS